MPLDLGRVTHLIEQMHRSEDDAGDPIPVDKVLVSDGAAGFTWEDYAAVPTGVFLKNDTYEGVVQSHGNLGATETMDCDDGLYHAGTINANVVITLDGFVASTLSIMTVELTEDGSGGHTLAFEDPATDDIVWVGGTAPSHDGTAGTTEIYEFWSRDGGATIFGGKIGGGGANLSDDTPLVEAGAGDPGVSDEASRSDHVHPEAAVGGSVPPPILLASDHSTPFTFDEILQNSEGTDFLWASE